MTRNLSTAQYDERVVASFLIANKRQKLEKQMSIWWVVVMLLGLLVAIGVLYMVLQSRLKKTDLP